MFAGMDGSCLVVAARKIIFHSISLQSAIMWSNYQEINQNKCSLDEKSTINSTNCFVSPEVCGMMMKRSMRPSGSSNTPTPVPTLFLIVLFLVSTCIGFGLCYGAKINGGVCRENEREALLKIKNDLVDPSDRLASWEIGNGTDCCSWYGVVCDNSTGRVLELHLASISYVKFVELHASSYLDGAEAFHAYQGLLFGGKISPSLLNLTHLEYLNLSRSAFETIPKFLGSISSLKYLSISYYYGGIAGEVPPQLGNLTNLVHLNLHGYSVPKNFHWLSTLSSLQCLEFSDMDLSGVSNWFEVINTLPSLQDLTLSECQLLPPQSHPTIIKLNFSSLSVLDLSYNSFSQSTISWVSHFKHLKSLNIAHNSFQGSYIPHVLQNLTSLSELDLSGNGFYSSIPNWVYHGFPNLELLNLADNNFQGKISDDFQNLTSLITLDLSRNFELIGGIPTSLRNLCKLRTLSLSSLNFTQEVNEVLENLLGCGSNGLEMLDLRECNLVGNWSTKDLGQFKNLAFLDLSGNSISGPIPMSLGELKSLTSLDLSRNSVSGSIPRSLGELKSLTSLDLSFNKLDGNLPIYLGELRNLKEIHIRDNMISGPIPTSLVDLTFLRVIDFSENRLDGTLPVNFGNLKNLEAIRIFNNSISGPIPSSLGGLSLLGILLLSDNKLNGTLPSSFGKLSNLVSIDISRNLMEGDVSEVHFKNLSNLVEFYASGNKLKLRVNSDWIPPLQLQSLLLGSWHIGTEFPIWLPSLKNLSSLDLSNSGLSSTSIPSWFWNLSSQIFYLNLSHNHIHGVLPNELNFLGCIDLSSNHFQGTLPHVSSDLTLLDLSNNSLSGSISRFLCRKDYAIEFLNLEKNHLSGEIPDCWNKWLGLKVIKLSSNHFNGSIPETIGSLAHLTSLHLRRNNLSGELPQSLGRCRNLVTLDIGENKLEGKIPRWIGEKLSKLVVLGLRTNNFGGRMPKEICGAASLHILDLANNNLSGTIPNCISNFSEMAEGNGSTGVIEIFYIRVAGLGPRQVIDSSTLQMKGVIVEYNTILGFVRSVDLSNNRLSGEIPEEVTGLKALQSLNLSHNYLSGRIPKDIGFMTSLESLDFSSNQLSGEIPQTMSRLTFLGHLNLSHNKLSGRIPSGTQIQGFDSSCFVGNELCGKPLADKCSDDGTVIIPSSKGNGKESEKHGSEMVWFYATIAVGFIVGFWGVVGPLLFNRNWRFAYFQFLQRVEDKIYVWWH